ncbi:amino acid ABC transporter substrate-binding protein (PAAT family) [Paraburkholderia sp. RAU2J]|uniref:ABC transporter substrate-binding protein n=1 Tax=Paraburkholderia sp. RAU2J TaxID=1938810 RepID=UPI000EACE31B|nr:ABC transporter substrate-binding protein [Paraburkholderia sp. RAU2J]RKT10365.1 amino acid ABC transporter substrate-binding protein (PAAT family) [Paraburkholderia sp. RAU2J]
MKKIFLVAISLAIACFSSVASADDWSTIRFGVDPTSPPFESKTPSGTLVGFDIDLGTEICARLHAKCVWVENEFDGLIPALAARKFDAILSAMSMTEKRRQQIDFSSRLYKTPNRLVVRKGSGLESTPTSLKGKKIGVQQGSIQETYAKKYWEPAGAIVVSYQIQDQVYADLISGRLDGVFQDAVTTEYGLLKTQNGKNFEFSGGDIYSSNGAGIGFRKNDVDLENRINKAIEGMLADGTYSRIAKKYFEFNPYGS